MVVNMESFIITAIDEKTIATFYNGKTSIMRFKLNQLEEDKPLNNNNCKKLDNIKFKLQEIVKEKINPHDNKKMGEEKK